MPHSMIFKIMMKFGKHLYRRGMSITPPTLTESDYCQVRLDFIELVIHPNRPIVDLRSRIIQIKSTFQVYIISPLYNYVGENRQIPSRLHGLSITMLHIC